MILICSAYGGTDEGISPEAVAVPLTPAFLESMRARQRLTQSLLGRADAADLDSLIFRECSPQWLTWSDDLDEVLQAADATGWTLVEDCRVAAADPDVGTEDRSHAARTDCDFMQVWPECFQFACRLRNTDAALESAMLYFNDFFTAVAHRSAAAQGRQAA